MALQENKLMNLADGKALYDDLRERVDEKYTKPANGIPVADLEDDAVSKPFIITLTDSEDPDPNDPEYYPIVSNKSFSEILAAIRSGKTVIADYYNEVLHLVVHDDYEAGFAAAYLGGTSYVTIDSADNINYTEFYFEDVQINGTSIVDESTGIANIPIAGASNAGVVKANGTSFGLFVDTDGTIKTLPANASQIKTGTDVYKQITPYRQHESIFYGLSKLAGVDLASGSDTVGIYPANAKSAIQAMLGVESGISLVETVSGTTPSITGQPNVRYVCGEVSTISITPPANGTIDVVFESGTTATVLTVPNTVKFPAWFDATSLDADTIYEIMITDGTYGAVMTWVS